MMLGKRKSIKSSVDTTKAKVPLTEQSLLFVKQIISTEFSISLPLTSDDFVNLCEFIYNHYEIELLDDAAENPISGFEDIHAKAVQFVTECSNNEIDIADLNLRLTQNNN